MQTTDRQSSNGTVKNLVHGRHGQLGQDEVAMNAIPIAATKDSNGNSGVPIAADMRADAVVQATSWSQCRDEALAAALSDRLMHDARTSALALSIRVRGSVAHVRGEVSSEEQRALLRRILRTQGGLYAVWDLLTLPRQAALRVLDVGCGDQKQMAGATGLDRVAAPGVDVVTDLESTLPFEASSFDHIFAVHVLEHIHDLLGLMRELHRVLRPTGVLHVLTPYWRHVNAVADPTHVRLMDAATLKYFTRPRPGVEPWRPLMVHQTEDTVFADLQPIKDGTVVERAEIARWFYH